MKISGAMRLFFASIRVLQYDKSSISTAKVNVF